MKAITLRQRLRYQFDNSLSRGTVSLISWLGLISLFVVAAAAIVLTVTGFAPDDGESLGFVEGFWQSLMRTLDSGTMGGDVGWGFRIVMLLVTLGGIFIVSALIGVIASGLESKFDELRKGRSFVVETNHTLVLGWSSRIFLVISELVAANENQKKPRIVILADKDKIEMEDEIRAKVGDLKNTKIVCRRGSPIDLSDLEIVNPHASKSIIILSPEEIEDPDAQVIKMILAITNNPQRRPEPYHIVAEIQDERNMDIAAIVGKSEAKLVLSSDLIARITVQTCRQSGLSVVYKELLDFDGDEIYFQAEPQLVGKTFGESLSAYEKCAVIGLSNGDGGIFVNPPHTTKIADGDKIIVIAAEDDQIKLTSAASFQIDEKAIRQAVGKTPEAENILILGWNKRGKIIARELENYVAAGSRLTIVADVPNLTDELSDILTDFVNLKIEIQTGDTTSRMLLNSLDLITYQHIIILCYAEELELQAADAKTLMTLLHLRDIEEKRGESFSVVSEMLDVRNRALAEVTKADDFIVSDELTGLLLTQIAENGALLDVFSTLFDSQGSEIYLKDATDYVAEGEAVNFYTVVESARRRYEIAIGYRILDNSAAAANLAYGVCVNPPKNELISFAAHDKIIVIAES